MNQNEPDGDNKGWLVLFWYVLVLTVMIGVGAVLK
jgi:hypothetical protein